MGQRHGQARKGATAQLLPRLATAGVTPRRRIGREVHIHQKQDGRVALTEWAPPRGRAGRCRLAHLTPFLNLRTIDEEDGRAWARREVAAGAA
eukprot:scaffold952_cov409-Prasinococcus_capsulatus_cf.AAC.9